MPRKLRMGVPALARCRLRLALLWCLGAAVMSVAGCTDERASYDPCPEQRAELLRLQDRIRKLQDSAPKDRGQLLSRIRQIIALQPRVDSLKAILEPVKCWVRVRILAVRVADDNGEREAIISPEQVRLWVEKVSEVFQPARIRFEFEPNEDGPDWKTLRNTTINRVDGDEDEAADREARRYAEQYPKRLVVFFRYGSEGDPVGGGFSSGTAPFVIMPSFDYTSVCCDTDAGCQQNIGMLAHEIGHYLGLPHTFGAEFGSIVEAETYFLEHNRDPAALNGDPYIADTPPEPFIQDLACTTDRTVVLAGAEFQLNRENIMSYYFGEPKSVTRSQAYAARSFVSWRFGIPMD